METADTPTLILSNLPQAALAGIDLLSFTTTPRFQGVKNLPPGFHFTYVGSSTAFSERHGLWFQIPETPTSSAGPPLSVTKWDSETETLVAETNEAEVLRWRANLGSIWQKGLTPYRQTTTSSKSNNKPTNDSNDNEDDEMEELVDWSKLTSQITPSLLTRIIPNTTNTQTWSLSSASSAKRDLETIPGLTQTDITAELAFLPINLLQTWREGATGRERTDAAQDRTWALLNIIQNDCTSQNAHEIVGEMQFAFMMILTLNNFSCLEQWKRLLGLVFTCKEAVATHANLFVSILETLRLQLQHCKVADNGLIDLTSDSGNLLRTLLIRFRKAVESLHGHPGIQAVADELDDLEEYLQAEHGWQFGGSFAKTGTLELEDGEVVRMDTTAFDEDDETGEYAPLIVDLTPEQARLLNVGGAEELHLGMGKTTLREDDDESSDEEGGASDDDEYEMQDLDEMDSRY